MGRRAKRVLLFALLLGGLVLGGRCVDFVHGSGVRFGSVLYWVSTVLLYSGVSLGLLASVRPSRWIGFVLIGVALVMAVNCAVVWTLPSTDGPRVDMVSFSLASAVLWLLAGLIATIDGLGRSRPAR